MKRFMTMMSVAILFTAASPAAAQAKRAVCPPTTAFSTELEYLDGYRVFTGPDGDSAVEPLRIPVRTVPLLKTGKQLGVLDLPKGGDRAVQIFIGPANVDLPLHAAPYKELFVLLSGSFVFKTAKFSAPMKPGSVLLFEDVDAKIGHGARVGPCGYVSLSIKPPQ